MKLATKTFVVTGAGSGIGRELTLQLLQKGANVAGVDINSSSLLETGRVAGLGEDRFKAFDLDITSQEAVNRLPGTVTKHFGTVDGIINNAGIIQPFKPVYDLSIEDINRVMNVNFFGTLYLTKAFLPLFLQRPEAHITNISSMGGFLAVPGQTLYGASKAAVKIFTEGLYAELMETNVGVTVVFPGAIATNITENSGLGKPKASGDAKMKPLAADKAAGQILTAIERNRFRVVVGPDAKFLDILYRFNPRYATQFIQQKMKSLLKP
ncbi:SDR family NAD(P)-dependent oxidoreductase [Spirosoma utsteinense]|uniref:Short-subunit dehydrogenase n=1 Tax=Spirosoma utsteinense TaxID=2585773 RepID=A0ABR6WBQ2_9BACT|nr:SDR family NAD(P)-dependent oxidoreductase [Spirosoma utsteinense]MBC3784217.1 short-subunit dehydrogenase [Spirosoma utsteinense]MBC3793996.1 short-subunit dehydrogenase [Spirosoma utsteinense]